MRRSNDSELLHCVGPLLALRRHSSIADGLPLSGEGGRVADITPMAEVDPELTWARGLSGSIQNNSDLPQGRRQAV